MKKSVLCLAVLATMASCTKEMPVSDLSGDSQVSKTVTIRASASAKTQIDDSGNVPGMPVMS